MITAIFRLNAMVVYHLPQKSGNFGWNVNGKPILVFPNGKFPEKTGFLERYSKIPKRKTCLPFACLPPDSLGNLERIL